jgi:hypothetical protein
MKMYGISFKITFINIDESDEVVTEEAYVTREYDDDVDPVNAFDEEFNDACEDDYVDIPSFDFDSEMRIVKIKELKS